MFIMRDSREDARIIPETGLFDYIKSPKATVGDGESWCSMPEYTFSSDVLQGDDRALEICSKLAWRLGVDQHMAITMGSDFLPSVVDTADEV
jgi:hypothetical protein